MPADASAWVRSPARSSRATRAIPGTVSWFNLTAQPTPHFRQQFHSFSHWGAVSFCEVGPAIGLSVHRNRPDLVKEGCGTFPILEVLLMVQELLRERCIEPFSR
jgi:hypothetical protein